MFNVKKMFIVFHACPTTGHTAVANQRQPRWQQRQQHAYTCCDAVVVVVLLLLLQVAHRQDRRRQQQHTHLPRRGAAHVVNLAQPLLQVPEVVVQHAGSQVQQVLFPICG